MKIYQVDAFTDIVFSGNPAAVCILNEQRDDIWLQKDEFTAYQASQRGGVLKIRVQGDRVLISGKAVTVLEGDLLA
mgnify:CR=1 FL=1